MKQRDFEYESKATFKWGSLVRTLFASAAPSAASPSAASNSSSLEEGPFDRGLSSCLGIETHIEKYLLASTQMFRNGIAHWFTFSFDFDGRDPRRMERNRRLLLLSHRLPCCEVRLPLLVVSVP